MGEGERELERELEEELELEEEVNLWEVGWAMRERKKRLEGMIEG